MAPSQPTILSELLCILGAEGCAVDVSTSVEFKVPFRIGLLLLLVFPVTAQPAILSELLCILGAGVDYFDSGNKRHLVHHPMNLQLMYARVDYETF